MFAALTPRQAVFELLRFQSKYEAWQRLQRRMVPEYKRRRILAGLRRQATSDRGEVSYWLKG